MSRREGPSTALGLAAIVAAAALCIAARVLWREWSAQHVPNEAIEDVSPPGLGDERPK